MSNKDNILINNQPQEMSLLEILSIIWNKKLFVILFTMSVSICSLLISFQLTPIYKSDALLEVVVDKNNDMPDLGAYGGLAAMAGVDIGSQENKTFLVEETIKSRVFLSHLIKINPSILSKLLASNGFNQSTKEIKFDSKIFDSNQNKWVRKVKPPLSSKPSLLEAHEFYLEDTLRIAKDKLSGFIIISIEHPSPYFAKDFLDLIIKELNNTIRINDLNESIDSINFLTKEAETSKYTELKNSINGLIKTQLQKKMISQIRKDYIVKPIDTPHIPEKKIKPQKSSILIASFLASLLFSCLLVLSHFFLTNKD